MLVSLLLALSSCAHDPVEEQPAAKPVPAPSAAAVLPSAAPSEPPKIPAPERARVYVKNRFVFVRPRPDAQADWLGFLWFGASVELKSERPVAGPGCATFYAIEPFGFVCVDERQATLDAHDPTFELVSKYAPRLDRASPHRYAESLGAGLQSELSGHEWPKLPAFFHEARRRLLPLSTVAYVDEPQTLNGVSWLPTADLLWLKREQVELYPEITFHGIELGGQWQLPVAFFRQADRVSYRRIEAGRFERTDRRFELHSVVALTGKVEIQHGQRYFELRDGEGQRWVREQDAVLPVPRSLTPWGARVGELDRTGRAPKNERQTWLEVSVLGGWLLAFEGTKPVFATLVSPGKGGIPRAGEDPLEISATPLGTFPISGKLATVTMQAPGEFVHSEVPWTQNIRKPYAIHSAYWHDNWGNLQSGGCINVSPADGKWLFEFSEPRLPAGWHAVRWQAAGPAPTLLVVHE